MGCCVRPVGYESYFDIRGAVLSELKRQIRHSSYSHPKSRRLTHVNQFEVNGRQFVVSHRKLRYLCF